MVVSADEKGKFWIKGQKMHIRAFNSHIVVRVGGGWDTLTHYLQTLGAHKGFSPDVIELVEKQLTKSLREGNKMTRKAPFSGPAFSATVNGPQMNTVDLQVKGNDEEEEISENRVESKLQPLRTDEQSVLLQLGDEMHEGDATHGLTKSVVESPLHSGSPTLSAGRSPTRSRRSPGGSRRGSLRKASPRKALDLSDEMASPLSRDASTWEGQHGSAPAEPVGLPASAQLALLANSSDAGEGAVVVTSEIIQQRLASGRANALPRAADTDIIYDGERQTSSELIRLKSLGFGSVQSSGYGRSASQEAARPRTAGSVQSSGYGRPPEATSRRKGGAGAVQSSGYGQSSTADVARPKTTGTSTRVVDSKEMARAKRTGVTAARSSGYSAVQSSGYGYGCATTERRLPRQPKVTPNDPLPQRRPTSNARTLGSKKAPTKRDPPTFGQARSSPSPNQPAGTSAPCAPGAVPIKSVAKGRSTTTKTIISPGATRTTSHLDDTTARVDMHVSPHPRSSLPPPATAELLTKLHYHVQNAMCAAEHGQGTSEDIRQLVDRLVILKAHGIDTLVDLARQRNWKLLLAATNALLVGSAGNAGNHRFTVL